MFQLTINLRSTILLSQAKGLQPNSRIVYTTIFVLKSVKKRSKAARFCAKCAQKLLKSAHISPVFQRFSTVQQYPESVFTPINTDFSPKSAKNFHQIPVFHFLNSRHFFFVSCAPCPADTFRCAHIRLLFVCKLLLKNCFLIEPGSENVILWRLDLVLPKVFGQKR